MEPAEDEEALYELLYDNIKRNGKRGLDAGRGDDDSVEAQEIKRLKTELSAKTEECATMLGQINDLQLQVKKLKRMKETLADNISSLFKTAAAEIARKDGQNKELSARFRAVQGSSSLHFHKSNKGQQGRH